MAKIKTGILKIIKIECITDSIARLEFVRHFVFFHRTQIIGEAETADD
jgi:hypothetical protein